MRDRPIVTIDNGDMFPNISEVDLPEYASGTLMRMPAFDSSGGKRWKMRVGFPFAIAFLRICLFTDVAFADRCKPLQLVGKFDKDNRPPYIQTMEAEMNHKMSVAMTYLISDQTWHNIVVDLNYLDRWIGTTISKVISIPMLPQKDESGLDYTQAQCRRLITQGKDGEFNPKWKQFASTIKEKFGDETLYLRLGWEFNMYGKNSAQYTWGADYENSDDWKKYWRNIVTIFHETLPNAKIVWCIGLDLNDRWDGANPDPNHISDDQLYPGDEYVDVIGIDKFDFYPSLLNNSWNNWYYDIYLGGDEVNGHGLRFCSTFARNHGKPLSFPEWGLVDAAADSKSYGNDDPYYIARMYEFITDPQNNVLFHIYTPHYHDSNPMTEGMKEYRRLFSTYYNSCGPLWIGRPLLLKAALY
jgi:hypothetical protein